MKKQMPTEKPLRRETGFRLPVGAHPRFIGKTGLPSENANGEVTKNLVEIIPSPYLGCVTADEFKRERELRGSQSRVAAQLGTQRQAIARREAGKIQITPQFAAAMLALPAWNMEAFFWSRVGKDGLNCCWTWSGATNGAYGLMRDRDRKIIYAHRFSYKLATGKDPGALFVCHRCDNPECVNPRHLFLGTCADNIKDAARKGRMRGGANPRRIVPKVEIDRFADRTRSGESYSEIAREFGVSPQAIWSLLKTWRKHQPGGVFASS